jgi:transposase
VSAVARRHGIKPPLLFRWLKERSGGPVPTNAPRFVPVVFPDAGVPPSIGAQQILSPSTAPIPTGVSTAAELIEIELQNGRVVRVGARIDLEALKQIIAVLEA